MASVTHTYVSPKVDLGQPDIVGPNEWNDTHTVTGTPGTVMGFDADGNLAELPASSGATLIKPTPTVNFYVATTGDDTTGDGSVGNPWRTADHACNYLRENYFMQGLRTNSPDNPVIQINVAAGTYTDKVHCDFLFNVLIVGAGATTIWDAGHNGVFVSFGPCWVYFDGIKVQNTGTPGNGKGFYTNWNGATFAFGSDVYIGSGLAVQIAAESQSRIWMSDGSTLHIQGGANQCMFAGSNAFINIDGGTIELTGTPHFSEWFAWAAGGVIFVEERVTITGSATGVRFKVQEGGGNISTGPTGDLGDTAGLDFLPGDQPGSGYALGTYDTYILGESNDYLHDDQVYNSQYIVNPIVSGGVYLADVFNFSGSPHWGSLRLRFDDVTGGSEDSTWTFGAITAGTTKNLLSIRGGGVTHENGTPLKLTGTTSGTVTVQTAGAAGTYSLTLPTTAGTNGNVLTTDGTGILSWTAPGAAAISIGSSITAGSAGRVLFEGAGPVLADSSHLLFDSALGKLTIQGAASANAVVRYDLVLLPFSGDSFIQSGYYNTGAGEPSVNMFMEIVNFSSDGYGDGYNIRYSRGSQSVRSKVLAGDGIGGFYFYGDDGVTMDSVAAHIDIAVADTASTGIVPGIMSFSTTDSTGTSGERLRMDNFGNIIQGGSGRQQVDYTDNTKFQQILSSEADWGIGTFNYNSAGNVSGWYQGASRAAQGGSSPAQAGDVLFTMWAEGDFGGDYFGDTVAGCVGLRAVAESNWSTDGSTFATHPAYWQFVRITDDDLTQVETMRIDSVGRVGIGMTPNVPSDTFSDFSTLQVGQVGANISGISIFTHNPSQFASTLSFQKTRATSPSLFTTVQSNDNLGIIYFSGADGTQYLNSASISVVVDGTPGTNSIPTRMVFFTASSNAGDYGDAERMRIDSDGSVLLGDNGNKQTIDGAPSILQTIAPADTQWGFVQIGTGNNINSAGAAIVKTRGTSGSPGTIVQNNDGIGSIDFYADDGTKYVEAGQIGAEVDGTPGISDMPTRLLFSTTPDGGMSWVERMRIASDGRVTLSTGADKNLILSAWPAATALNMISLNGAVSNGAVLGLIGGSNADVSLYITAPSAGSVSFRVNGSTTNTTRLSSTEFASEANDTQGLGTGTRAWSDLFLADGGVINWNNGAVFLTHSTNTLAYTGATNYTFDNHVIITTGATSTAFALSVGRTGATNPAFQVNPATGVGTGLQLRPQAAGSRMTMIVTSSTTDEGLSIDAKGAGTIRFGSASTGAVEFSRNAVPTASDGAALGTTALQWSDLFLASGAVINFNNGNLTLTHSATNLTIAGGTLTLAAGTATAAPLVFTAGSNLTTAANGAMEFDDQALFFSPDASDRRLIPTYAYIRQHAAYVLSSSTTNQKLFNSSTNGQINLPTGAYRFNCMFSLSGMSATTGNGAFVVAAGSGATVTNGLMLWTAIDATTTPTAGAAFQSGMVRSVTAPTNMATASTLTEMQAWVTGTFEVSVAGQVIPSIALTTGITATNNIGSFFECWRLGATTDTNTGKWS